MELDMRSQAELMSSEDVPEFPTSRQIVIGDKPWIEALFEKYPTEVSERTFGSLFMWRNYERRSELFHLDGHLVITWFRAKFGRLIFQPVGPDPVRVVRSIVGTGSSASREYRGIYGIVEPEVSALKDAGILPESLRDEWDYVYRTGDLTSLEGSKYHTQRKELKKATSLSNLAYEPMTKDHQRACLELEETWCDLKHCILDKFSRAEDQALKEAIDNLDEIGFFGGVALVNGKVQALTVGERLNKATAAVHFEKANPAIRGLYQFINQQFCRHALEAFEYVNREQDVGEPGLRRAKEGYHPHHFVEKHILMLRQRSHDDSN